MFSRYSYLSLFALLAAAPALAAPAGLQKNWNVTTLKARNAPYCAMVGKFEQGVSMVIARTADGYSSLAVDLNKNIFKPGQSYDLTLQIDNDVSRRYSVHAVSPRSFIVQTGADEALYGAIGDNSRVNLKVDAVDLSVAAGRFIPAYANLVSCIGALPKPAEDAPRVAAAPVTPVEQNKVAVVQTPEWQTKLAQAQAEKEALQKQLTALLSDKSALAEKLDSSTTQIAALRDQLQNASAQNAQIVKMLDSKTNENNQLQNNYKALGQKLNDVVSVVTRPAEMPAPLSGGIENALPVITASTPDSDWDTLIIQ